MPLFTLSARISFLPHLLCTKFDLHANTEISQDKLKHASQSQNINSYLTSRTIKGRIRLQEKHLVWNLYLMQGVELHNKLHLIVSMMNRDAKGKLGQ